MHTLFDTQIKSFFPLSRLTWLRVGGPARVLFQPKDSKSLQTFMQTLDRGTPVFVLGAGSNVIIRDGGFDGVVIRLGTAFRKTFIDTATGSIRVGAAVLGKHIANQAAKAGLDLSFFATIPGTIGGIVAMNAGCFGYSLSDVFVSAQAISRTGQEIHLSRADLLFGYRFAAVPEGCIITEITLQPPRCDSHKIQKQIEQYQNHRTNNQPEKGMRSAGSMFRNPCGHASALSTPQTTAVNNAITMPNKSTTTTAHAWRLIDKAGMRGARYGDAQISSKHANFLLNTGQATAHDLESLGERARAQVFAHVGYWLEWEIQRVGCAEAYTDRLL